MSDQTNRPAEQGGEPLFQNMDEQEQRYAPAEVPDSDIPPVERDRGETAAEGTAVATDEGDQTTTRTVPIRGTPERGR